MTRYYDSKGNSITLTDEIGRGGEGAVFRCQDSNLVAKIYSQPVTPDKADKLKWMAQIQNERIFLTAAWIVDTLHRKPKGETVGFLMPNVAAKEIHELYSPKSRRFHFPNADWRFLLHVAINLARAFNSIHATGNAIADVNQSNFVVTQDGTVKLIDCDSYHIRANGRVFQCEVGVPMFLPPELQGAQLSRVARNENHDRFGLALLIFQLLFLGRHPFSGAYVGGTEDKTLEDCIREKRFAYGSGATLRQVKQPPGAPSLEIASEPVAKLFERAFLTENQRPLPQEWIDALSSLSHNLIRCEQHLGHYYLKTLRSCPWCAIEAQAGTIVFPVVYNNDRNGFNILTIEQLINSLNMPVMPVKPAKIIHLPESSVDALKLKRRSYFLLGTLSIIQIGILISLVIVANAGGAFAVGFFSFLIMLGIVITFGREKKKVVRAKLELENTLWKELERRWQTLGANSNLSQDFASARNTVQSYKRLPQLRVEKLQQLEKNVYHQQLFDYLDGFRIDRASIYGIGAGRATTLQSYGVETAADVEKMAILRIPGFGPTYTYYLLSWRQDLESRFVFDSKKGVSVTEKQRVEHEIANLRFKMEKELENSIVQLKTKTHNVNTAYEQFRQRFSKISTSLAQAESDAKAALGLAPSVLILLAISFGVPLFAGIRENAIRQASSANSFYVSNYSNVSNIKVPNSTITNASNNVNFANTNSPTANKFDLSEYDISVMSSEERLAKAKTFYRRGIEFTKANNYTEAQKYYREALRYDSDPRFYHELGYAMFRLKRFNDAADSLQKALENDLKNDKTKELLGLTYISMKKWQKAKEIFEHLAIGNPSSFQIQYNHGLASKNDDDLGAAILAFQKASQIKPNIDYVHYELGQCYLRRGQFEDAEYELEILITQKSKLASKFQEQLRNH